MCVVQFGLGTISKWEDKTPVTEGAKSARSGEWDLVGDGDAHREGHRLVHRIRRREGPPERMMTGEGRMLDTTPDADCSQFWNFFFKIIEKLSLVCGL